MAVTLEIDDGDPWYLSPNVWTVPGTDPLGSPSPPVAGQSCYLWARVRNTGADAVSNATVRFYWANPAVGFDRTTATLVGTANVSLPAGASRDVLCLTRWFPIYVNEGHECILAEAFHSADPLPATAAFNVPTDRHVAQRNLGVLLTGKKTFSFPFEVHNPWRMGRVFVITAQVGKREEVGPLEALLGRDLRIDEQGGTIEDLAFTRTPCPEAQDVKNATPGSVEVELGPGERIGLTLVGRLKGSVALAHVLQLAGDQPVGGLGVLVLSAEEGATR